MEHFYQQIQGWFSFPRLYASMVQQFDDATFVEVGTWLGRSAAYMATEIANSKKNIKFFCVDTWEGSEEHKNMVKNRDIYQEFLNNTEPVKNIITPYRMLSHEAVERFEDNSLDFVFIDASHDYDNVMNDLKAWYPKVKQNGVFAGHDYIQSWPGVKKAVGEFFCDKHQINSQESCWLILK
jgi:predicted O-methyltransferase YrrM